MSGSLLSFSCVWVDVGWSQEGPEVPSLCSRVFADLRWGQGWAVSLIFISKYWAGVTPSRPANCLQLSPCLCTRLTRALEKLDLSTSQTEDVWPNHMVAECTAGSRSLHFGLISWEFLIPPCGRRGWSRRTKSSYPPPPGAVLALGSRGRDTGKSIRCILPSRREPAVICWIETERPWRKEKSGADLDRLHCDNNKWIVSIMPV